ncbi:hypothetical protein PHYSODRAFT_315664 [Phytophthora sojae]|uniref:Uncharacterized protein n=1 Tax=Phytophthora sojae (strain P6497) TaxID=1094619 RepID=G4ZKB0_PHYSP|nr:hypothetical protein PHYSODRAFT_315664 [Phytophthora sojae]EGZ15226.1 hypothetical protein PHYSODRAFT_315664 [Phytophthora sojae]|eukprot:XP_009528975.1 hypothetical protein PHYSODRAFT_315664 [Phytophthora sojae]
MYLTINLKTDPGYFFTLSKLDAFERFRLETSFVRVLSILILAPVLWLSINLLLECIPLNDPSTGFWRSGFFQLRMGLVSVCSSIAPVLLKLNCVPDFPMISMRAIAVYTLFQTVICLGTNVVISLAFGAFPVPFSQFTVILPMAISGRFIFFHL